MRKKTDKTKLTMRDYWIQTMDKRAFYAIRKAEKQGDDLAHLKANGDREMMFFRNKGWVIESHTPTTYATGNTYRMSLRVAHLQEA